MFGGLFTGDIPFENDPSCSCKKGHWELSFTLSVVYNIKLASESSPVWNSRPPDDPAPFPPTPSQEVWDKMTYKQKRRSTLQHEKTHVAIYRSWHEMRRVRIEVFESLQYPSKEQCDKRGKILKIENEAGYKDIRRRMRKSPHEM